MDATNMIVSKQQASAGRWLCLLGGAVLIGGVAAYAVQFAMKHLTTPWYVPILGSLAVVLMVVGFLKRPTVLRGFMLLVVVAFCAFEWYFILGFSRLPEYTGTAKPGQPVAAFSAFLADGRPFTDAELRDGKSTIVVFFRGRW